MKIRAGDGCAYLRYRVLPTVVNMTIFGFLTEPAVIFLDCGGFSVMYNSLILETVIVLLYLMTNAIITFIIKKRSLPKN